MSGWESLILESRAVRAVLSYAPYISVDLYDARGQENEECVAARVFVGRASQALFRLYILAQYDGLALG